uniref:Toll like receptor n=1 Tax=Portunus trituberculatus TaxID=210409 RepID=A0A2L0T7H8_PORTR|nr:toll like receptor [Portunus trituberculatus]
MLQQIFYFTVLAWMWIAVEAMGCGMCEETVQNSMTCSSTADQKVKFSVDVSLKGKIRLQCLHSTEADYSLMEGCDFSSVTHAEFLGCALPNVSYKEVLYKIGVNPESVRSLAFLNVSKNGTLLQQHLEGLNDLKMLQVTGIHSVASDVFRSTLMLEAIEISDSTMNQLGADLFHNMTKLQIVMLQHNMLEELPDKLFSGTPSIRTIQLHNNQIRTLQDSLFKDLKFLTTLNVSKNKLEKLSGDVFSENHIMEYIDMSENLISEIHTGTFTNLQKLKVLNLGHNRLKTLPWGTLKECLDLQKLWLNNNFLTHRGIRNAFPRMSSLRYLDLGYNNISIRSMSNFALHNQTKLQYLFLNNNNISIIPDSLNNVYVDLVRVDFSWNSFEVLNYTSLIFQSNVVELDFKFNNIETVDFTFSFSLHKKKTMTLALEGNPLLCHCRTYGFLRMLQGLPFVRVNNTMEITVKDIEEAFCQLPSGELVNLMEMQTETITCRLTADDVCSYDFRLFDGRIVIDCSYQNLKSIGFLNLSKSIEFLNLSKYNNNKPNYTLILANNRLTSLAGLQIYTNLLNLVVPYNKLSSINTSHLPPNLKALDVRGNNLTNLSPAILDYLNATDMSLKLGSNPWHCSCDMLDLFQFLHVPSRKVNDFTELQCESGELVMDLSEHDLCPFFMQPMVIVTIVVILILLTIFSILGTVSFYKYKQGIKVWLYAHHMCLCAITEDELDADKKYDAFISYSHMDEEFVMKELVPGLECGEPKYRVCLHYRDWVPGEYIQNQIMQSVEASRRTIVVLSSSFIESVWGQLEFRAAHSQALQDRTNRLIIIVYGKIPAESELDEKLKLYITTKTYVRWGDSKFWDKLRYIMPHPPDLVQKKRNKNIDNKLELSKSPPKQSMC